MNRIFFIALVGCSLLLSSGVHAQKEKQRKAFDKEAFLARRNAFITAEMGLTPEEAALFIPLCNELEEKKFETGREYRKLSKKLKADKKETSDSDYLRVINECVEVEMRQAQLEKEYYEKFKKVVPPKKLYKYKYAERKFMHKFYSGKTK